MALLSDNFINQFPDFPKHMSEIGQFVYYRTYSRYLSDEKRRETWKETVRRAVEYNCNLVDGVTQKEAETLFTNIFNLKQFLSGRTFWVGGTPVADKYPMANYNCSFIVMNEFEAIRDLFYVLMIGSGAGFRILKSDVDKFPKVRQSVILRHAPYKPKPKEARLEHTNLDVYNKNNKNIAYIKVGDSKEGWVEAIDIYFRILSDPLYRNINNIIVNYDSVRPKGEKLLTFGGTASGHESLKIMFTKIDNVINTDWYAPRPIDGKLRPIHILDICNIIGENVVSGGVRRTSEIALIDADDEECILAKQDIFNHMERKHRFMSNNTIFFTEKPSRERMAWLFEHLKKEGEPGFFNLMEALRRNPYCEGMNPCGEVLLSNRGMCNLTTVNVSAFVDDNGNFDLDGLIEAQKLSARAGLRMTNVTLELPRWDKVQKEYRLIGCSITGWQDALGKLEKEFDRRYQNFVLDKMHEAVRSEADRYAEELGFNKPLLATSLKPEGTLSLVAGGVSSGVHYSHSPYYIRRIRISVTDPLYKATQFIGWKSDNEVGQGIEINGETTPVSTKVLSFPMKSPCRRTKYNVSAISQLQTYFQFQQHYTEQNSSNTISVREEEWAEVEQRVYDNWDDMLAVSFLSLDDNVYELAPYEAISKEEYEALLEEQLPFDGWVLNFMEDKGADFDLDVMDCSTGACPIR